MRRSWFQTASISAAALKLENEMRSPSAIGGCDLSQSQSKLMELIKLMAADYDYYDCVLLTG